jgi:transcriptional regulator with XRE-family HTH domain
LFVLRKQIIRDWIVCHTKIVYAVGVAQKGLPTKVESVFAENLKALRTAANITQDDFARKMSRRGFSWYQATVYKVENGERQIQLAEAEAAAQVLKVPLAQMMRADPENASRVMQLRDLHWDVIDARSDVVTAVYKYASLRQALAEAIADGDRGWIPATLYEEMRRDADLAAIRDWAELKTADALSVTRKPPLEEAVFDAET